MTYDASCLATFFALDEVEKSFLFYKLIINSLQIFTTGRINQFTLVHLEDVVGWSSDGCQSNISNSGSSLIFPLEGFFAVFKTGASSESSKISIYLSFLLAFIPFPIDAFFFFSETLLKWWKIKKKLNRIYHDISRTFLPLILYHLPYIYTALAEGLELW